MDKVNKQVEENRCPLCSDVNQCSVESGDCWCFNTKFPIELNERLPEELVGKVCICQKCVEKYKRHSNLSESQL
ncbi:MAG: cysteine-rich CWC family protein [Candidatus Pristimantibacillus sp.]